MWGVVWEGGCGGGCVCVLCVVGGGVGVCVCVVCVVCVVCCVCVCVCGVLEVLVARLVRGGEEWVV